ncbi:amidase [Mycolicibacterium vaccae]|uniref:amidase n=1 Tax=Mycolicibacterium vaccae TaxID=1810 RepID=UPI003D02D39E
MQLSEYTRLDATALAALVADGEVTADELTETARAALQAVDAEINAVVEMYDDARVPGPSETAAAFAGVPFLMKDFGAREAGRRQWMGSWAVDDVRATSESPLAQRFRESGLVTIGRSATCEFAVTATVQSGRFGPTRNPWDVSLSPGGSSGGAAAAVAAGVVPMAHATDSGGSIRIPAACCGLVGLKPTRGAIPLDPAETAPGDFHTEFVLTRSVRDAARALTAFGTGPGQRPAGRPYRIAVATRADWLPEPDPVVTAATLHAARLCEGLGHTVGEAAPRIDWPQLFEAMKDLWAVGTADLVGRWTDTAAAERPIDVEGLTWELVERARRLGTDDVDAAMTRIATATAAFTEFFSSYDILLTPTLPAAPPPLAQFHPDMDLGTYYAGPVGLMEPAVAVFNATGQPGLSIPATLAGGRPVGVHLAAAAHRDADLLALAAELEAEIQWPHWTPSVHAGSPPQHREQHP